MFYNDDDARIDVGAQIDADSGVTLSDIEAEKRRWAARRTWVPARELGPELVAQELWRRAITYVDNPDLFESRWWDVLPKTLKCALKEAARHFPTIADWRSAYLAAISVPLNQRAGDIRRIWRNSRLSQPFMTVEDFKAVLASPTGEQRRWIGEHARIWERTSYEFIGLEAHRMPSVSERDWQMTRRVVEGGLTEKASWRRWLDDHPADKLAFSAASVAIKRTKPRLYSDRFARMLAIYVTNFPRIPALTCECQWAKLPDLPCVRCHGTGRIPYSPGS
jgi:hypothetical protein